MSDDGRDGIRSGWLFVCWIRKSRSLYGIDGKDDVYAV